MSSRRRKSNSKKRKGGVSFDKNSKNLWQQPPTAVKATVAKGTSCSCKKKNIEVEFSYKKLGKKINGNMYITQSNGGPRFLVEINSCCINIYSIKYTKEGDGNYIAEKHVFHTKFDSVFIGQDKRYKDFKGSAILIEVAENSYIYVCDSIASFKTKEPIKLFYLNIGNSAVPYPYAVDVDRNAYALGISLSTRKQPQVSIVDDKKNEYKNWSIEDPHKTEYEELEGHEVTSCKAKIIKKSLI